MEQLLHLERLEKDVLAGVEILAVSPDPPDATRELIRSLHAKKGVRLTHRFVSDAKLAAVDACGARNTKGAMTVRPLYLLYDRTGHEVWRFSEKHARMAPTDDELREALGRLRPASKG